MKTSLKRNLLIFGFLISCLAGIAQKPAHWDFSVVKTGDKKYQLHIVATLDRGWHIYAQQQPPEAVATPTKIAFTANPLIIRDGKTKEVGKLNHWEDRNSGIKADQYNDKIEFIQDIEVKGEVKLNIAGTISYQVCTDEMCLPPATIPFSVPIQ